jgi:hypothetical protein
MSIKLNEFFIKLLNKNKTMQIKLSELPQWLQSDFYHENVDLEDDCVIPKTDIKIDTQITCLQDILQIIDTCAYFGVDKLPNEVFEYACQNPPIYNELHEFEKHPEKTPLIKYAYFIKTPEYQAIRICVINQFVTYYTLCHEAVLAGNMPLIQFCIEEKGVKNIQYIYNAVSNNHKQVLKYLLAKYPEWKKEIDKQDYYLNIAVKYGHLEMLKYLREVGAPWSEKSIHTVALQIMENKDPYVNEKRYECLEYMIKNGCRINEYEINYTTKDNNTRLMRFLIEIGELNLEFNTAVMDYFAVKGDLEIMKYLFKKGMPFTVYTAMLANKYEHNDCLEFAVSHGAPYQPHWNNYSDIHFDYGFFGNYI